MINPRKLAGEVSAEMEPQTFVDACVERVQQMVQDLFAGRTSSDAHSLKGVEVPAIITFGDVVARGVRETIPDLFKTLWGRAETRDVPRGEHLATAQLDPEAFIKATVLLAAQIATARLDGEEFEPDVKLGVKLTAVDLAHGALTILSEEITRQVGKSLDDIKARAWGVCGSMFGPLTSLTAADDEILAHTGDVVQALWKGKPVPGYDNGHVHVVAMTLAHKVFRAAAKLEANGKLKLEALRGAACAELSLGGGDIDWQSCVITEEAQVAPASA